MNNEIPSETNGKPPSTSESKEEKQEKLIPDPIDPNLPDYNRVIGIFLLNRAIGTTKAD